MKTPKDHTSILLRRSSFLFFRWRVFNFLPSSTLRCFDFCRLFVNASFLRFKTWHYANFNIKYGVLSMNWWIFTWISVLIYLTFPALHSCYLLYMGRARISKLCSSRCYLIPSLNVQYHLRQIWICCENELIASSNVVIWNIYMLNKMDD